MKELLSPGVEVFVDDQSQYVQGSTNSVPFVLLATASNKASGSGVGIAQGTLPVNANNVYLMTSQRDLLSWYGKPLFYTTSSGAPINGDELNEYGLLAAYSSLGISNRCYIQRVDVNLQDLKASLNRPMGSPNNGSYWFDTANSTWGINEWNVVTTAFTVKTPKIVLNSTYLENDPFDTDPYAPRQRPVSGYGDIGDYAVNALEVDNPIFLKVGSPTSAQAVGTAYFDSVYNSWIQIGSKEWMTAWPTITGGKSTAGVTIPVGQTFTINGVTITVPAAVAPQSSMSALVGAINGAAIPGVYAANINEKLMLYCNSDAIYSSFIGAIEILFPTGSSLPTGYLGINPGIYNCPMYQATPSFQVPRWRTTDGAASRPTGSVWFKTNAVNGGTKFVMKSYDSVLATWSSKSVNVYYNDDSAIYSLDPSGGGYSIPAKTIYAQVNPFDGYRVPLNPDGTPVQPHITDPQQAGVTFFQRFAVGPTVVSGMVAPAPDAFTVGDQFKLSATQPGTMLLSEAIVTISSSNPSATTAGPQDFVVAVSSAGVPNISASIDDGGAIVLTHATGGDIHLVPWPATVTPDFTTGPIVQAGFIWMSPTGIAPANRAKWLYIDGQAEGVTLSNWVGAPTFTYTPSASAPSQDPLNGTKWYYSGAFEADIMIQNFGKWVGYQTVAGDVRGYNLINTDENGPIFSVTAPTTQTNAGKSPLVYGDIWIDTSDLVNYPKIYRWSNVSGQAQWVLIDNADNVTENGILFADARWSANGCVDPVDAAIPSIKTLLKSSYTDLDAPNPALYPQGMLLFNLRRSSLDVKSFAVDYFNTADFSVKPYDQYKTYYFGDKVTLNGMIYVSIANSAQVGNNPATSPTYWGEMQTSTWVTVSSNNDNGSPNMGRNAQRIVIVKALESGIDNSAQARQEQLNFNLIACPQYPELTPAMVNLNLDRNDTAFVIGDTPLRLAPDQIQAYVAATSSPYLDPNPIIQIGDQYTGIFYPSCQTRDLSGNTVVTAPSHMMIRTIIRSDQLSWPWYAPAGVRRGMVENALRIGYLSTRTNEFIQFSNDLATRDLLYSNHINPITFQPGVGIMNFGNKTCTEIKTALDRINVARLISYLRVQLYALSQQFLFEPNDQLTRDQFRNAVTSLMLDIQTKRGIYDYLVICDLSNNTPTTIDRSELWLDLAIEPVKAVEFIYIPIRVLNTGAISALQVGS